MGFRFRKSVKLGPVRLTASKSGLSSSVGVKGLRVGVNSRGTYVSSSIPGTGIHSIDYLGKPGKRRAKAPEVRHSEPRVPTYRNPWIPVAIIGIVVAVCGATAVGFVLGGVGVIAVLIHHQKPSEQALRHLRKAEKELRSRGEVDVTRALEEVEAAIRADSSCDLAPITYHLARIVQFLVDRGDSTQAMSVLEATARVAPDQPWVDRGLGILLERACDYGAALPHLRHAHAHSPNDESVVVALAECLAEQGRMAEALSLLQQSTSQQDPNLRLLLRLSKLFERDGHPDLAIETLKRAPLRKRNLNDELLAVHYRLGRLYDRGGDKRKAKQHYNRVFSADVGYADVRERIAALTS